MKQFKLLTILMLLALALVCFAACGEEGATNEGGTTENGGETAAEPVTVIYCNTDTESRSTLQAAYWMQQKWEEETDGQYVLEVYANNTLGDDSEVLKGLLLGTANYFTGMGVMGDIVGTVGALVDMPFVYSSYEDWYNGSYNLGGIEMYDEALEGTGYSCHDLQYAGAKHLWSGTGNFETLDDLKGFKIRCTANDMNLMLWETLGANPTPVAWGELYTALQQKTVDGMEHSMGIVYDQKFYEPNPYGTKTYHTYCPYACMVADSWVESLTDEQWQFISDSMHELNAYQHELELDAEANVYEPEMIAAGVTITDIPEETRAQMVELTEAVYDFMREECGAELIDAFIATGGQV